MCKAILAIIVGSFVVLSLTGCIGFAVGTPKECGLTSPTTLDPMWTLKLIVGKKPEKGSTKEDFLRDWGKPDEIITTSVTEETWVYKRDVWCGIMPVFIVPVPLLLPVCDGYDKLDFKGNEAVHLYTKRTRFTGCYFGFPTGCKSEPCWPMD